MTRCVECQRFTLKGSELAAQGYGNCLEGKLYEYFSPVTERECSKFSKAPDDIVTKRMCWINERSAKSAEISLRNTET